MRKSWKPAKPMNRCEQYARDVVSGKQVAGELIIKAAKRFLKDLRRTDIYFDEVQAMMIVNFAERYVKLAEDKWKGKPMIIMPWMAFVLMQIYGWIRKSDGKRRVRKVYLQVAKKNAKTTIAALINIFHVFQDERINTPNVYVCANGEEQAVICTNMTGKLITNSPDLNALVEEDGVKLFQKKHKYIEIVHVERDGFIKAMSKEPAKTDTAQSGVKHGINCSLVVVDEYSNADSDNGVNTYESAQASRDEPLTVTITTASSKQNGPCFQVLRKTGIEILDGVIENDAYLPFIYELDEEDDMHDKKVRVKANPNLGVSVSNDFLDSELLQAKIQGGSKQVDVETYNFNRWVDSPVVWVPSDVWKTNHHKIKEDILLGRKCYGGLEIVSGLDLNAFVLYFPRIKGEISAVKTFFWMADKRIKQNKMKMDCSNWVKLGLIKTTPGDVIDNAVIFEWILAECQNYSVHSLAFNIVLQNHDIIQGLSRVIECNPIAQSYNQISEPSHAWEEMLTAAKVEHFNNLVLAWMNSNCLVIRKDNNIKVQRNNGRVAGISAIIHALAQCKTVEAEPKEDDQLIESWG